MSRFIREKNGLLRQLAVNQKPVHLERHISGQFKLQVGSETVLLTPDQALGLAKGIFEGLGIGLVEQMPDQIGTA